MQVPHLHPSFAHHLRAGRLLVRRGGRGKGLGEGVSLALPDESSGHVLTHLLLEGAIICSEGFLPDH